jgi:catalase
MDYLSYIPESTHMFMWWFDDWGIPSDYRHMEGFAVHTFKVWTI